MTSRRASSRLILGYIVASAIPMEVADVFFCAFLRRLRGLCESFKLEPSVRMFWRAEALEF